MADEPKRRWLSFSLRTLFALMTVGAALTFAGLEHQRAGLEHERANLLEVKYASLQKKLSLAVEVIQHERAKSASVLGPVPREGTAPIPNLRPRSKYNSDAPRP